MNGWVSRWYAYTLSPSGVPSFAAGKKAKIEDGEEKKKEEEEPRTGGEPGEGMKKDERQECGGRVTEEFRNDRWPVASLTDDALLRSRLQAQKDGTAVMDSKWLEIVGCCHRASSSSSSPPVSFGYLYLSSHPSPRPKLRHAMHSVKDDRGGRRAGEGRGGEGGGGGSGRTARMELRVGSRLPFFARPNFRSRERRGSEVNRLPAREKTVVHNAVISGLTLAAAVFPARSIWPDPNSVACGERIFFRIAIDDDVTYSGGQLACRRGVAKSAISKTHRAAEMRGGGGGGTYR